MLTAHPFNISQIRESQCEGGRPHGSPIPKGASTIKLVPSRLVHIAELRGGQFLQHLDHSRTITATWGCTVLLSKPRGVRHQGFMCECVSATSMYFTSIWNNIYTIIHSNSAEKLLASEECIHVPASHVLLIKASTGE